MNIQIWMIKLGQTFNWLSSFLLKLKQSKLNILEWALCLNIQFLNFNFRTCKKEAEIISVFDSMILLCCTSQKIDQLWPFQSPREIFVLVSWLNDIVLYIFANDIIAMWLCFERLNLKGFNAGVRI